MPIAQDRLKQLVTYDPETGIFMSAPTRPAVGRVKFGVPLGNKNRKGYMQTMVDGTRYSLQRLAFIYMTGDYPKPPYEVDHINGDKTDNRWCNLRSVLHRDNLTNPNYLEKARDHAQSLPRCPLGRFTI